jgi:hypothetical protein
VAADAQKDGEAKPREGPSVTYHLKARLTIPSRNDPQLIEVARIELAPSYFYKTVPVLAPHVYRQATLANRSEFVLLPGEATMYVGTDFVGRMNLPLVAIGEQFTAGFGVDPQIQVTRELLNRARSVQGGNQVQTYDYRIRLQSFKPGDVQVQVWDRMPRGEAEAVGVGMVKAAPELSTDPTYVRADRPKNLLRWDVTSSRARTGSGRATSTTSSSWSTPGTSRSVTSRRRSDSVVLSGTVGPAVPAVGPNGRHSRPYEGRPPRPAPLLFRRPATPHFPRPQGSPTSGSGPIPSPCTCRQRQEKLVAARWPTNIGQRGWRGQEVGWFVTSGTRRRRRDHLPLPRSRLEFTDESAPQARPARTRGRPPEQPGFRRQAGGPVERQADRVERQADRRGAAERASSERAPPVAEPHARQPARDARLSNKDIGPVLRGWEYEAGTINVRKISGADGRPKLQMRLDLGLLQMEMTGRPDGRRPFGCESLLEHYESRLADHEKRTGSDLGFTLTGGECRGLREEAVMYYQRYLSLFVLEEFPGVVRDTARNLRVLDLCSKFAVDEDDKLVLEQYRPYLTMMNARPGRRSAWATSGTGKRCGRSTRGSSRSASSSSGSASRRRSPGERGEGAQAVRQGGPPEAAGRPGQAAGEEARQGDQGGAVRGGRPAAGQAGHP